MVCWLPQHSGSFTTKDKTMSNSTSSDRQNGHVGLWEQMSDERLAEQCLACERRWWELNDRIGNYRRLPAYVARPRINDLRAELEYLEEMHKGLLDWTAEHRPEVFEAVTDVPVVSSPYAVWRS